uniref:Ribonuclease J n=1 Tax=candidate division CPR3 bacterium TaxID=2268181 RepID=A0A7C5USH6_UNCC3
MEDLKITILGGCQQIGCNATAFEYGDSIIVVDMGLGFPEGDVLGVDYLLPNISYLKQRRENIRGIVITHGHLDHIGAIPYIGDNIGWPTIYAPAMASELIKVRAEDFGQKEQMDIQVYKSGDVLNLGPFKVSFARVTHNIPDSYSVFVHTPYGIVIVTGDWKFDNTPYKEPPTDYGAFTKASEEGVLLLCSDSTNAMKSGWSDSESEISRDLEYLIEKAPGRVIASTFASLITRLSQIVDICRKLGRKIVISGRSMETTVSIARHLKLIEENGDVFVTRKDSKKLKDKNICILATGSQGEETSSLVKMANDTHPDFKLKAGDTVILSSSVIPGNEMAIYHLMDKLTLKGANVFHNELMDVHAGGHSHAEDHKMMIHLTKPKFFMPVHGTPTYLYAHKKTALSIGYPEEKIIVGENGLQVVFSDSYNPKVLRKAVPSDPVTVDGLGIGDVDKTVLSERNKLADDGIVFITIERKRGKIVVISRGVVNDEEKMSFHEDIKKIVREAVDKGGDDKKVKNRIEGMVQEYIHSVLARKPLVVPVVM